MNFTERNGKDEKVKENFIYCFFLYVISKHCIQENYCAVKNNITGQWEMMPLILHYCPENGYYPEMEITADRNVLVYRKSYYDENENFLKAEEPQILKGISIAPYLQDFDITSLPHTFTEAVKMHGTPNYATSKLYTRKMGNDYSYPSAVFTLLGSKTIDGKMKMDMATIYNEKRLLEEIPIGITG